MNEQATKMEPWVLVLILVCVLAFFGGLWALGSAIDSSIQEATMPIEAKIDANAGSIETNRTYLNRISSMVEEIYGKIVKPVEAAAPAPEGAQPAVAPAAAPAPAPAPAPEKK